MAKSIQPDELLAERSTIDFKAEIIRKGIHLCSLSIPLIYYYLIPTKELALQILVPMLTISLLIEYGRFYHPEFSSHFYKFFRFMLRNHELNEKRKTLTGASTVLLSAVLGIVLLPKVIFTTAFMILIVSDITAALVGRAFGRKKFLAKSFEGAIGFFLSAVLVVMVAPKAEGQVMEYLIGMLGAALGAVIESSSLHLDDNLTIPFGVGLAMWGLYVLLMPTLLLF